MNNKNEITIGAIAEKWVKIILAQIEREKQKEEKCMEGGEKV